VRYPLTDMLRLIALESHLHRAIVIGEDLGTVPSNFRQAIGDKGVLGIRVLWFERAADGGFVSPREWSDKAMATTSTHDVSTVAGWWSGRDVEWRKKTGLDDPAVDEVAQRERERALLWRALCASGSAWNEDAPPSPDDISPVVVAAARHVAQAPAPLAIFPVEDVLGLHEQPNLPGPTDAIHPNWRRRMPDSSSRLFDGPIAHAVCAAIDQTRNRT
jgi:4-alpha-glucanotransferase